MEVTAVQVAALDEVQRLTQEYATGMMDAGELAAVARCLLTFPWRDEIVVEVGTYHGRTAVFMAKVLAVAGLKPPVLCIDAFERMVPNRLNMQGSYAQWIANVLEAGLGKQCFVLSAASEDAVRAVSAKAGVLILDGWHSYEMLSGDFERYAPWVVPGGYLFIDDYGEAYPGVIQAVDEFAAARSDFRLVEKAYYALLQRVS